MSEQYQRPPDGHIAFQGLSNTRDMGGIAVASRAETPAEKPSASDATGMVVPYRLLRSGVLSGATPEDLDILRDTYQLRTIIDLRTEEERFMKPDPLDALPDVQFVSAPLLNPAGLGITNEGGLKGMLDAVMQMEEHPAALMQRIYVSTVLDQRGQEGFSKFFQTILDTEEGAVLWHCSAGKDRTGMTAALLLYVLGASEDDIMDDYLASNRYLKNQTEEFLDALAAHGMAEKLDSIVRILNSVRPEFLIASRDAIVQHYGSVDDYLVNQLNLTPDKQDMLRQRYVR